MQYGIPRLLRALLCLLEGPRRWVGDMQGLVGAIVQAIVGVPDF